MSVIQEFQQKMVSGFAARVPCIYVESDAPERAYPEIGTAYASFAASYASNFLDARLSPKMVIWHPRNGLPDGAGSFRTGTQLLAAALDFIREAMLADKQNRLGAVFVLPHIAQGLAADPDAVMAFEELMMLLNGDHMGQVYAGPARLVITGMAGFEHMPPLLTSMITRIEFPFPDENDIVALLQSTFQFKQRGEVPPTLVSAMLGLGYREAQITARIAATMGSDLAKATSRAMTAKIEQLKAIVPFARFIPPPEQAPPFVGMARFIDKIERVGVLVNRLDRKSPAGGAFTLIGPPGTGKSSSVAMLSWITGFPVIGFSFSDLMQSLVGKSEERLRRLFRVVRAMDRVIVFADEMDKQSPDMRGTASDGGLAARLQAAYLSEMQESFSAGRDTLWVATANRVGTILPEFFDRTQVWTVGYPPQAVIAQVFEAHLSRLAEYRREDFDFYTLAGEMFSQFKTRLQREVSPRLVTHALREACQLADVSRDAFCPTQAEILAVIEDMSSGRKLDNGLVARSVWDDEQHTTSANGHQDGRIVLVDS
jgi:hypothetical protein